MWVVPRPQPSTSAVTPHRLLVLVEFREVVVSQIFFGRRSPSPKKSVFCLIQSEQIFAKLLLNIAFHIRWKNIFTIFFFFFSITYTSLVFSKRLSNTPFLMKFSNLVFDLFYFKNTKSVI